MRTIQLLITAIFILLLFLFDQQEAYSQIRQPDIDAEMGVLGSGSSTPFWHYANTRGRIFPGSQFNQYTLVTAESAMTATDGSFDFGYGATALSRFSDTQNAFRFEQLYGGIRFGGFQLKAGRFHDEIGEGMIRTDLSFGSMIQSQNAVPIPKIQLRTVDYIDVPFTQGVLSFKGMYSDGILEADREIESPYIHQKSLHAKISIENGEVMFGVIHNVVWAGTHPDRGRLPQGLDDYLRIVTLKPAEPGSATKVEESNRLGNSVAAYDFAGTYRFHNTRLLLYRQIYLEDTVGARVWRSYWDGTYGIGLQRVEGSGLVNSFMYEIIHTIKQDSESRFYPQGRANYYGHYAYQTGWTYKGAVIGNPLLTFDPESERMINNVVVGHHIGVSGDINPALNYKFYVTYTRNHGVCRDQVITGSCNISNDPNSDFPLPPDNLEVRELRDIREHQFSFLVTTSYLVRQNSGVRIHSSLAADVGQFYGNRVGLMAGISISDFSQFLR